ncbi:MAG: nicotinate-nucleotide--dimethylbenzimidazole phosphoribosyltransferase [Eubacteriales bacterium]|nr:nicotinate-nucleotide--dimethylbenzimidazole phosphoribosyltransferase [Eubacteriales bacterium]
MTYEELLHIKPASVDQHIFCKIKENWDCVAKPLNGLGAFEEMIAQIGAIQGREQVQVSRRAVIVMCADNGVVEERVSQSGQDVTAAVTRFMGVGQTSVGKMGKVAKADIIPVDIGVNWSQEPTDLWKMVTCAKELEDWLQNGTDGARGIIKQSVCRGTRNFAKEPAMAREEVLQAIQVGMDMVKWCKEVGYHLVATGEMGIGNTTTSAAIAAALTGTEVELVTGRGAGLSDQGLRRKCQVIREALSKYGWEDRCQSREQAFEILRTLGGLDIAGMAGVCIGGALYGVPVVLDGVISVVAALVAQTLMPGVKEYLIASHVSRECAAKMMLEELSLQPVIYGDLALGEGTGAVMLFSMLDVAMSLYESETTFQTMEIEQYQHWEQET